MLIEYNAKKHKDAAKRIWLEVGWLQDKERQLAAMDCFIDNGRAFVAEVNGEAECLVTTVQGTIRHIADDLSLCAVASVATGRVARKHALASRLAAKAVAENAADGTLVAALGMFEQGFYNQLGFGSGGYEHLMSFDPARLLVDAKARIAQRIGFDDWAAAHASRLARRRTHGAVNLTPPEITRAGMIWSKNGFGLGYYDGPSGELTHHLWCATDHVEHGPYSVEWLSYQTPEQFLELMALLRGLGDQVRSVKMHEPPAIQLQDMVEQPSHQRQISERSPHESGIRGIAYWQARINDVSGCLERTRLRCGEMSFNLDLTDPIAMLLDERSPWLGVTGQYVVTLGPSSGAEPGTDSALPTLSASTGAFTRLWLGVRPATGLAVTDELSGPPELLEELDWALRLPDPKPDWDF